MEIFLTYGYIKRKLRDILEKIMEYIWTKLWDIFGESYKIYLQKRCISLEKIWDIVGKNYGIDYGIYMSKAMGYIGQKLWDI